MDFFHTGQSSPRLFPVARLRKTRNIYARPPRQSRTLLKRLAARRDSLFVPPSHIVGDGDASGEDGVLRVLGAHPHSFIEMSDRIFGLPIEDESPAEITMRSSEV